MWLINTEIYLKALNNKETHQAAAKELGRRLGVIARERGILQCAISELSGIRETTISRILTGKFAANSAYLCRIADAVGVRIIFDCDCG